MTAEQYINEYPLFGSKKGEKHPEHFSRDDGNTFTDQLADFKEKLKKRQIGYKVALGDDG